MAGKTPWGAVLMKLVIKPLWSPAVMAGKTPVICPPSRITTPPLWSPAVMAGKTGPAVGVTVLLTTAAMEPGRDGREDS